MIYTVRANGINGNGSNGVMSLQLPLLGNIRSIQVEKVSGTIGIDKITDYKFRVNGELVRELTGTDQDELNKRNFGAAYTTNSILTIPFAGYGMRDQQQRRWTSLHCNTTDSKGKSINNLSLEMTFTGATNPLIQISLEYEPTSGLSTPDGVHLIERVFKYTDSLIVGEQGTTKLPYGTPQFRYINYLGAIQSGATLSLLRVLWGQSREERFNRTPGLNDQIATTFGVRTKGSYFNYVWDNTETGYYELWDTLGLKTADQNVQPLFTSDTASAVTYYWSMLGELQ